MGCFQTLCFGVQAASLGPGLSRLLWATVRQRHLIETVTVCSSLGYHFLEGAHGNLPADTSLIYLTSKRDPATSCPKITNLSSGFFLETWESILPIFPE